jgi:hypothetical protein
MPAVRCPQRFCLLCSLLGAGLLLSGALPAWGQEARADADALRRRAEQLTESRQYLEALQACQEALRQCRASAAARPDDLEAQLSLVRCRYPLAEAQILLLLVGPSGETLDGTRALLQQLLAKHPGDAALRFELSRIHFLRAERAAGMMRADQAVAALEAELKVLRGLAAEKPGSLEYRQAIVKALRGCSTQLAELARHPHGMACLDEALRTGRQLAADFPDNPRPVEELALACVAYGFLRGESFDEARGAGLVREGIGLLAALERKYPEHPEYWHHLPAAWLNFAQPQRYHLSLAEAEAARHEVERLQAKLARYPDAAKKWLTDEDRLFNILLAEKDHSRLAANPGLVEGLVKGRRQKAREHPEVPFFEAELGMIHSILAAQLNAQGATEAALAQYAQGVQIAEKLAAQFPDVPRYRLMYAKACAMAAPAHLRCGKADEAERLCRQAIAAVRRLAADFPAIPGLRVQILMPLQTAAAQLDAAGADRCLAVVLEAQKELVRDYPDCVGYRDAARTACGLAQHLDQQGADARAEAAYREGVGLWRQAAADFPAVARFRLGACTALSRLAGFLQAKERYAEAEAAFAEMIALSRQAAQQFPDHPDCQRAPGIALGTLALCLDSRRQDAAALQSYSEAIACTEAVLKTHARGRASPDWLRTLLSRRADLYLRLGHQAEHEADRRRAQELDERLRPAVVRLVGVERGLSEGKRPQALQEADDLFAGGELSAPEWAELARLYALAAGSAGAADGEAWAARAVEALGHALGQGYAFAGPLGQDARFRGLAGRADFQKLAAEQAGR